MVASTTGVVFDLDGTLIDSEPFWARGFSAGLSQVLAARGHGDHPLRAEEMERFHGGRVPDTVAAIVEAIGLRPAIDDGELAQVVEAVIASVTDDFLTHPIAIAEAVETARALHDDGVTLGLASSSAPAFIDGALRALDLDDVFETRISALPFPRGKPDPAVYLDILDRIGLEPSRALAIEDSYAGVASALNAGMRCLWFRSPLLAEPNLPDAERDEAALGRVVVVPDAGKRLTQTSHLDRDLVVGILDDIERSAR